MGERILLVNQLKKHFHVGKGQVLQAVDGITFDVQKGETFGLVGESGCGKSTIGRTIMSLYETTAGEVTYEGKNIHTFNEAEKFAYYRKIQMIYQDPYASLNPRSTVQEVIAEPMEIHHLYPSKEEQLDRVYTLLEEVCLQCDHANRYTHDFSSGQRQRIVITRSLALTTAIIIAAES